MRKSYTRGLKRTILVTLIMWFISISMITALGFQSIEKQYKNGDVFDGHSGYAIIKILAVEEQKIQDKILEKNEKFYLIEHEHGYIMLRTTAEKLDKMLGGRKLQDGKILDLGKENIYARIDSIPATARNKNDWKTTVYISAELRMKFENSAQQSYLIKKRTSEVIKEVGANVDKAAYKKKIEERPFYNDVYIVPVGTAYYTVMIIIVTAICLSTLWLTVSFVKKVKRAKENYEKLFIEYPETERDIDILVSDAGFVDEKLKVLIYKDALIIYNRIFNFELLNNIKTIIFDREIGSRSKEKKYFFKIEDRTGKITKNISIGKYKENTEMQIVNLGKLIKQNHKIKVIYTFK
ncbi:hypothetical protein [Gemella massiliensis]|uniref:hypothetical protein n=1 Tax=Gemella massiliensis TaxID=1909670 RepID=UPI00093000D2|nr:hypothetical protein [Gemella massiliensis]